MLNSQLNVVNAAFIANSKGSTDVLYMLDVAPFSLYRWNGTKFVRLVEFTDSTGVAIDSMVSQDKAHSATPTWNLALGRCVNVAVQTANITAITLQNIPPLGQMVVVQLLQDNTAGRTIVWPNTCIFGSAWVDAIVTTDANKKCTVVFVSDGTNLIALGQNVWH